VDNITGGGRIVQEWCVWHGAGLLTAAVVVGSFLAILKYTYRSQLQKLGVIQQVVAALSLERQTTEVNLLKGYYDHIFVHDQSGCRYCMLVRLMKLGDML
jgi:hypothetical protein